MCIRDRFTMGALCETVISNVAKVLLDGDMSYVSQAFDTDAQIDQKERDIESLCLKMLLRQQPVARDLRKISAALKMITDMEPVSYTHLSLMFYGEFGLLEDFLVKKL